MNKYRILAICGKAGSGKSAILKNAPDNFHKIVSCTTRPPREGEVDGKDYHFLSKNEFIEGLLNDEFFEDTTFRGWYYGTRYKDLSTTKVNIGIFNFKGIVNLLADSRNDNIDVDIIYIDVDDKERLMRQLNRENIPDVHEIIRRFGADEEDFKNLDLFYYTNMKNNSWNDYTDIMKYLDNYKF